MKEEKRSIFIVVIYLFLLSSICLLAINSINLRKNNVDNTHDYSETTAKIKTEFIYVPVYIESTDVTEESEEILDNRFIVRNYDGKIGVFSSDGKLINVIEVYIKTLPEKDRTLLEEGIWINSEEELNSIIQDYTG